MGPFLPSLRVMQGFLMGMADIVPGVSGGTMAYVLGIYQTLINALRSFDMPILRLLMKGQFRAAISRPHWAFLVPLGMGMVMAIIFFTNVVSLPGLMRSDPEDVYGLFFGLIVGSLWLLAKDLGRINAGEWLLVLAGLAVAGGLFMLEPSRLPDTMPVMAGVGFLAVCVMLLPGVSGSYLLLVLGKYMLILDAIALMKWDVLAPFILGMLTGFIAFPRLVGHLLEYHYRKVVLVINGLLAGSLWAVWPYQQREYAMMNGHEKLVHTAPYIPDWNAFHLSVALFMLIGLAVVVAINAMAGKSSGKVA